MVTPFPGFLDHGYHGYLYFPVSPVDGLYPTIKMAGISPILILKEKIAYFDDIQKTDKGLQVFLKNQDAPLPVSSMGDGFRSLLSLTFMNSLAGEGVIILEEPEVSLHPGFMYILCEAILKNSKESQFFISTHSMDFVRALLNVLKWEGQTDDIHIIRMFTGLATQSPDIEVLSGDDALNDIEEIGRDLRGI
ncbi:MAG: AAA family ATPase [Methanoculleus sp.]